MLCFQVFSRVSVLIEDEDSNLLLCYNLITPPDCFVNPTVCESLPFYIGEGFYQELIFIHRSFCLYIMEVSFYFFSMNFKALVSLDAFASFSFLKTTYFWVDMLLLGNVAIGL
jgi:hypothetical protein